MTRDNPDVTARPAIATMDFLDCDENTVTEMAAMAAGHPELTPEEVTRRWREQKYRQQMEAYADAVADNP